MIPCPLQSIKMWRNFFGCVRHTGKSTLIVTRTAGVIFTIFFSVFFPFAASEKSFFSVKTQNEEVLFTGYRIQMIKKLKNQCRCVTPRKKSPATHSGTIRVIMTQNLTPHGENKKKKKKFKKSKNGILGRQRVGLKKTIQQ